MDTIDVNIGKMETAIRGLGKAPLELTIVDYNTIGFAPVFSPDNPHLTHAETMSDDELREYIRQEVEVVQEALYAADYDDKTESYRGTDEEVEFYQMLLHVYHRPNIEYLALIGRLPAKFQHVNFEDGAHDTRFNVDGRLAKINAAVLQPAA